MRATINGLFAFGLILTACSPDDSADTTTSTSTSSTTVTTSETTTTVPPSTTTTTTLRKDLSPINGLPVEDPGLIDRRVLAIKIDNHFNARPQSGINGADMVIELMVEGITRFLTLWHQSDSDYLGPMRSARPTDPTLLQAFNEPTFAMSGAQNWVQAVIRSTGVHLIGEIRPATFRVSGRQAPHNLYVNTVLLREHADSLGYPDAPPDGPIWDFGPMPLSLDSVSSVVINFSGNRVRLDMGRVRPNLAAIDRQRTVPLARSGRGDWPNRLPCSGDTRRAAGHGISTGRIRRNCCPNFRHDRLRQGFRLRRRQSHRRALAPFI